MGHVGDLVLDEGLGGLLWGCLGGVLLMGLVGWIIEGGGSGGVLRESGVLGESVGGW